MARVASAAGKAIARGASAAATAVRNGLAAAANGLGNLASTAGNALSSLGPRRLGGAPVLTSLYPGPSINRAGKLDVSNWGVRKPALVVSEATRLKANNVNFKQVAVEGELRAKKLRVTPQPTRQRAEYAPYDLGVSELDLPS